MSLTNHTKNMDLYIMYMEIQKGLADYVPLTAFVDVLM